MKTWISVVVGAAGFAMVCGQASAATHRCGAAQDLMVQALERVSPDSTTATIRDANELLRRSEQMCSENGDTWYYRSLFETRLGHAPAAEFSLQQAKTLGSEALTEKLDPFTLSAPKGKGSTPAGTGTRWALVVGVGAFKDVSIPTLKYTAADARLFAQALERPSTGGFAPDHVKVLLNDEATTAAIKTALNWIARQAKPEDTVVIYIATHGSERELDSVGGANYLMTVDTQVGPNRDQDLLFGSALPMNDLVATVANRISARRTAIFIDTCFSGSTSASSHGVSVSEKDLERFKQGEGRIVMTASRGNEESRDSDALGHGYFTYYLVQALEAQGGSQELSAVYHRVAKDVSTHVAQDFSPMLVRQDPVLSRSSSDTDFSLREVQTR